MMRLTIWTYHPTEKGTLTYSTYTVRSYDTDGRFMLLKGDSMVYGINLENIHSFLATSIPPEEQRDYCKKCKVDGEGKYCYLDCRKAIIEG